MNPTSSYKLPRLMDCAAAFVSTITYPISFFVIWFEAMAIVFCEISSLVSLKADSVFCGTLSTIVDFSVLVQETSITGATKAFSFYSDFPCVLAGKIHSSVFAVQPGGIFNIPTAGKLMVLTGTNLSSSCQMITTSCSVTAENIHLFPPR